MAPAEYGYRNTEPMEAHMYQRSLAGHKHYNPNWYEDKYGPPTPRHLLKIAMSKHNTALVASYAEQITGSCQKTSHMAMRAMHEGVIKTAVNQSIWHSGQEVV